jgi:hypothetical protein
VAKSLMMQPSRYVTGLLEEPAQHTINEMRNHSDNSTKTIKKIEMYDFSGPLWEEYFKKTRQHVRFPRGYKEVSLIG